MFRNTTWFASLRNTLSPSIMVQWKTTPNERVQLLLETSHFSLHRDYGRKATCWTKTTESETSQPTFRWFAALPLWRDRWFFSGVLQGFLVLQAARGWSFMLIQCLYLDLLHAYKFTYILYTVDLWLYIVFTFPHRLWIFNYLFPPFHLDTVPENIPPLASRVWTTLQLERLLVRSSTVLDKFSVSSRSPMQNIRQNEQNVNIPHPCGKWLEKIKWKVRGCMELWNYILQFTTICTRIFVILVCTHTWCIYTVIIWYMYMHIIYPSVDDDA